MTVNPTEVISEPIQESYPYQVGTTLVSLKRSKEWKVDFGAKAILEHALELITEMQKHPVPAEQELYDDPRFAIGVVNGVYAWAKSTHDFQEKQGVTT